MLFFAAVVLTLPIYYFGMPSGNDLPQHFRFIHTFYDAVHAGEIYPVWPGETNLGFGDIGIRFYPPVAYYAVVLFRSFTDSWTTAISAAICFWFFTGGLGTFLLSRESFSDRASAIASIVFMAMPYHANQIYNAGLFAEFAGLAILPYCFLFVRRTVLTGRTTDIAALSVAYALLILTHLPLAIIGSVALLIYALALIEKKSLGSTIMKLASAVTASIIASAFYWVRMVSELSLVNHSGPAFTDRTYDFHQNFLGSILYFPSGVYGETSLWFTDLLFGITLAMIIPSVIVIYLCGSKKREIFPFLAVLAGAIFFSTPLSTWLWEHLELLRKIQFPWRILGLISLAGSVLIAGGIDQLSVIFITRLRPFGIVAAGLIIAGVVFTTAQVIKPADYSSRAEFDDHFDAYRADESYECWWPVWAKRGAFANHEKVTSNFREVENLEWTGADRTFVLGPGEEEKVRVATFYYPFWRATANGENVAVASDEDGTITLTVPGGRSTVRLFFEQPFYETIAGFSSLIAWLFLVSVLAVGHAARLKQRELI